MGGLIPFRVGDLPLRSYIRMQPERNRVGCPESEGPEVVWGRDACFGYSVERTAQAGNISSVGIVWCIACTVSWVCLTPGTAVKPDLAMQEYIPRLGEVHIGRPLVQCLPQPHVLSYTRPCLRMKQQCLPLTKEPQDPELSRVCSSEQ